VVCLCETEEEEEDRHATGIVFIHPSRWFHALDLIFWRGVLRFSA
jgi:hypothetical protein